MSMVALGCFNDKDPNGIVPGIEAATKVGYTHFDTATFYQNENAVGATLRASRIPRESLFVTTKLSNFDHHRVEEAFDKSLNELGLDYIDMYLMHWPQANKDGDFFATDDTISFVDTWRQMEKLLDSRAGKVKAIGVSNFSLKNLTELLKYARIVPAMNQIETHPYNQDRELVQFCQDKGIVVSAYSPLGFANSPMLQDQDIVSVAEELGHGITPANVLLSWNVQRGVVVLPKSSHAERVKENFRLVRLNAAQVQKIDNISNDPKRRHQRLCTLYDSKTDTCLGWTYEQLGWEIPPVKPALS